MSDDTHDPFAWAGRPDDDLASALEHNGHRWTNRLTPLLAILIVFVGGIAVGGWNAQRSASSATGSFAQFAALRSQFQGFGQDTATVTGGAFGAGPSAAATSGSAMNGTVVLVDAAHHKLYIRGTDGTTTAISTSGTTSALTSTRLDLTKIATGTSVSVDGTTGSDGTVAATSITLETGK